MAVAEMFQQVVAEHLDSIPHTCGSCCLSYEDFCLMYTGDIQKIFEFCYSHGLILREKKCPFCENFCRVDFNRKSFRCDKSHRNSSKRQKRCNFQVSWFKDSCFENCKLDVEVFLKFIILFLQEEFSYNSVSCELSLGSGTISNWCSFASEIILYWVFGHTKKIGGQGLTVEIEESKFGNYKYVVGLMAESPWMFGGICRETGDFFIVPVDSCNADSLYSVITEYVEPGTTVTSDCWKSYDCLTSQDYIQLKDNCNLNFVDIKSAHSNTIERAWQDEKYFMQKYGRRKTHGYLAVKYFILHYQDPTRRLHAFTEIAASLYPPTDAEGLHAFSEVEASLYPPTGAEGLIAFTEVAASLYPPIDAKGQPSTSSAVAEPVTAISTGDASGDEDGPDPLVDDSSEPPVQKVVDTTPDTLHASPIKDDRETDPLNVSPRQDGGKVVPQRKSQIKASAKNQLDKEPQNSCSYKSRIGVERKQKTVDSFFSPRICETAENELFLPQSSETKVPEAHHSEHDNNSSIQTKKRRLDTQEIVDDIPPKSEPVGVEQGNFEALGKYLAMQLKQLPLKNAISLQMEIHNLLAKEQCKVLEEKTAATETVTCNEMGLNHSAVNSRPTEIQNTLGEQVLNNNAVNSGMLRTVSSSSQQPSNSLTPTKSNNSIEKDTSTDTTGAITPLKATNAKKRKRGGNHIERVLDTPLDAKSAKETVKVEEAEFEAFGKFIATQLKQHPIKSAINLQIEIHNLIGKELVKCLQEQNSMAPSVDILAPDPGGDDWDVVSIKSEAESISSFEQQ